MKKEHLPLLALGLLVVVALGIRVTLQAEELADLRHQQRAYAWKFFTCRVLLDPKTRAIMDVRWNKQKKECKAK